MGSKEYYSAVLTTGRHNLFKRKLLFNVLEEISSAGGLLGKLTYTSPVRSLLSNKSTHISPVRFLYTLPFKDSVCKTTVASEFF